MKFAKHLEAESASAWAKNYVNYKRGKRMIKSSASPDDFVNDFCAKELDKVSTFFGVKQRDVDRRMVELQTQFSIYDDQVSLTRLPQHSPRNGRASKIILGHNLDYIRPEVTPRDARRRLKNALVEFHYGLELMLDFQSLNDSAFRKVQKKYNKSAIKAGRQSISFYEDRVKHSDLHRGTEVTDALAATVRIYAEHFAHGNTQAAEQELKAKSVPDWNAFSWAMFFNGLFLGTGLSLGVAGLQRGLRDLFAKPEFALQTSYLLQLYGGFLLAWLLMTLFGLDCILFERQKVNYPYIFQLAINKCLNWRQLLVLPSLFFTLLGLSLWTTFSLTTAGSVGRNYGPLILVVVTLTILFLPLKIFYHQSRIWFIYHVGRVVISPMTSITFPDFFIGDMLCSLSYTFSNIEVFFCVYANLWTNENQCNSSHSRVQGFFTALPAVWRALQCLRRFGDTKQASPHLLNFGKYIATCAMYATLSVYRMNKSRTSEVAYFVAASINSVYTIFWDVRCDWNLGQPKHRLLREDLVVFGEQRWVYYASIVWDVIVRCNWVAYIASSQYPQHSSAVAFFVALSEVLRRGVWSILRVENEHLDNVEKTYAYLEPPLPYHERDQQRAAAIASGADIEGATQGDVPMAGLRRRGTDTSVLNRVHNLDYARSREPTADSESSSDEDEWQEGSADEHEE